MNYLRKYKIYKLINNSDNKYQEIFINLELLTKDLIIYEDSLKKTVVFYCKNDYIIFERYHNNFVINSDKINEIMNWGNYNNSDISNILNIILLNLKIEFKNNNITLECGIMVASDNVIQENYRAKNKKTL